MPRTITRAQQTYPAGTYGPFSINQFTASNAGRMEATLTVVGWPNVSPLITVVLSWNTGGGATFEIDGEQIGIDGNPLTSVKVGVSVPRIGSAKKAVSGGTVTVTAHASVTTAITLTAI